MAWICSMCSRLGSQLAALVLLALGAPQRHHSSFLLLLLLLLLLPLLLFPSLAPLQLSIGSDTALHNMGDACQQGSVRC